MLATNSGDDAWIVKRHDQNNLEGVWKAICEWHKGSGNINTQYQQAMNTLQGIRFNSNSLESFSKHCNQFMEANRILQEIRRPQNTEAVCLFFLNSITAECCEMAKQICILLDYDLNKIILKVQRALQALDPIASSNVRHSNTEEPKKRTLTAEEVEQEVQGLWKYVDQKVPPDIWGNLHRKVRKTYIDKGRAYLDSKKSNPTPDGSNSNNSTHNVRFANGEDPSGGSPPLILRNRGSTDSRAQGGESAGTLILPSNAAHIRNLISNNHIMQSCLLDKRSINLRNTEMSVRACMDGSADTCLFNPGDICMESTTNRVVDLKTVSTDSKRNNVLIGTCIITVEIKGKPTLLVFNESLIGKEGDTNIISANQVHKFGHCIDDLAMLFGGKQCIQLASSKSVIPLELQRALISLPFRKPTEEEVQSSERIYMTSDMPWDPNTLRGQSREEQAAIDAVERINLGNVESNDNDDIETINCIRNRTHSCVNVNVSTEGTEERVTFVEDVCDIPSSETVDSWVHGIFV